jgi:hypothetical protein
VSGFCEPGYELPSSINGGDCFTSSTINSLRLMHEVGAGKDLEGSIRGLFQGIIPVWAWRKKERYQDS